MRRYCVLWGKSRLWWSNLEHIPSSGLDFRVSLRGSSWSGTALGQDFGGCHKPPGSLGNTFISVLPPAHSLLPGRRPDDAVLGCLLNHLPTPGPTHGPLLLLSKALECVTWEMDHVVWGEMWPSSPSLPPLLFSGAKQQTSLTWLARIRKSPCEKGRSAADLQPPRCFFPHQVILSWAFRVAFTKEENYAFSPIPHSLSITSIRWGYVSLNLSWGHPGSTSGRWRVQHHGQHYPPFRTP